MENLPLFLSVGDDRTNIQNIVRFCQSLLSYRKWKYSKVFNKWISASKN